MFRRFTLLSLLVITLLWSTDGAVGSMPLALQPDQSSLLDKVSPWVLDATADGAQTDFLVVLAEQANLSAAYTSSTKQERGRFVRDTLWETAQRSQASLRAWLDARDVPYRSFYIVNLLHVQTGDRSLVDALSARPDVARIEANPRVRNVLPQPAFPGPETGFLSLRLQKNPVSPSVIEWNVSKINADDVWALGYTGQGIVVGGQDTGYDWDHPALIDQYRGWDGATANHDYNWHDATAAGSPYPVDPYGHGTHTMGTVVGDDGGSNQIGMAPGAEWIGCRNMDSSGNGTPATYLECFEFFLAPYPVGGAPAQGDPDMAPDVTNNSWTCPPSEGCSWDTLQAAIEAQRAAGIMTVVSAGNAGPGCSSVGTPPGLYDASYSVGATSSSDAIASFSSRGPVTIDGSDRLKPDISAPGVNVRSSFPGTGYGQLSGTSMAAPHVAGAVALLWSAVPGLTNDIATTETYLNDNARHISSSSCSPPTGVPNNLYGWGRLDALAAVQAALRDAGVLTGQVMEASDMASLRIPIAGADIRVSRSPTMATHLTSSVDGLYRAYMISATYTLTVNASGYLPRTIPDVVVDAGLTTTLNITLTPLYLVAGTVTQVDSGLPLSATVSLPLSATVSLPGSPITPTQTDPATGFYSLTVPSGSYTLRAEAAHHIAQNRPITVTGNLTEDFYLEPLCELIAGVGFGYTPLEPQVREMVTFTATAAEGTAVLPVTYAWDFGDDVTNTVQVDTITHTFPIATTEQTYTVSLTITNTCPSQQKVKKAITVWPYLHTAYLPFVLKNY